jgi:hypothetical protein
MASGPKSAREDATTAAARLIIDAERRKQADKTARLRQARLAKETEEPAEPAAGKPRRSGTKAKRLKR